MSLSVTPFLWLSRLFLSRPSNKKILSRQGTLKMSRKRRFKSGAYLSDIPGCQKILALKRGTGSESVGTPDLCAVTPGSNCSLTTTLTCFMVARFCKSSLALVNSHLDCLSPVRILISLHLIVSMYIKFSHVWIKVLHFLLYQEASKLLGFSSTWNNQIGVNTTSQHLYYLLQMILAKTHLV